MAAIQMNLRIDAELKERGDASFAAAGYSPTQAVRAFWGFAAAHARDPQALRGLMRRVDENCALVHEGRKERVREAFASCDALREGLEGIIGGSRGIEDGSSDRDVRGEAVLARWSERGLL